MNVVAVVQARMGSTRLPGKVLKDLSGHPVLEWVVRAVRASPGIDEVWVATSKLEIDNTIVAWCVSNKTPVWRGSETDVLSRFVGCAKASGADVLLRITGDEPFIDPAVIGTVARLQKMTGAAYCSNVSPRTYPDGIDVQAFTKEALLAADAEATRAIDRDCVCTWIERNRSRFPAEAVINPIPGLQDERWVLDTEDDYKFCKLLAQHLPWGRGPPSQLDILAILDEYPELRDINRHHPCNERHIEALSEEPIYARSYERSQAQLEKARAVIPLGAQTFSKSYLHYPQPSPLFVSHGQGGLVWDVDGNEYVDLVSALLPSVLGCRDPDVDAAIRRQLNSGASFSLSTELEAELAETLCRLIPCAEAVRFGKSGTDATTAAIRLARAYTGRDQVLICSGYHGWADWSTERNLGVPEDVRKLSKRIPFGDQHALAQAFYGARPMYFAACIVEPESNPEYLAALREFCTKRGTVLIFDEVITGFRFDLGGAQKLWGVTPDLATFGKAMANGMPLSAVVGRRDIMKLMEPPDNIFFSGTMFGETLSLAAAIATIKKLERDNIIPKLYGAGCEIVTSASEARSECRLDDETISFHGEPPFIRIKFRDDQIAALFRKEMIASGTLIAASINVCAAHGPSEITRVIRSFEHTFGIIRDAIRKGDIAERLAGATVVPIVRAP